MAENEPVGGLAQARSIVEGMERDFPAQLRQAQESVRQSFEQGRAANSALMEFLNSQRGTGPSPLLQLASGLLRPTRAGGFGESLAAGAEGYAGALQQQRQGELDRAMRIQQLQAATANLGMQATQQQMALANQGLQFPAALATAYGNLADLGLLGGGAGGGTPTTRTQLAAPGGAGMPAPASPVGPQPTVTQTPLPPPQPAAPRAAPAAPAPAAAPARAAAVGPHTDAGNLPPDEFNQAFNAYADSLPVPGARALPSSPSVDATLDRLRAEQAAAQGAPAATPPAAAAAPAPAPAPAATPTSAAAARSSDPMVARAQGLLADAAANPERYAGPQGRALVERARTIVRESPEGQAEIALFRERAERQALNEDAANAANRRFAESTAEQQARSFQELATGAGEATQALGRLQQLETVMRDLPSGIPGWFSQQAARLGLGPQATQYEVATALLKQLIPAQRQGMPGAVSDFDARNFEASLPRLMSSPDGRRMVSDTLKSVAEYQVARGRIAMQAQSGEITRQEALRRFDQLASPFDRFNEYQERFAAEQAQRRGAGGGGLTPNADGSFNWSPPAGP